MNLDPAVMTLPFGANIDIRDTVRYKEVMKQFNLGPNGGILTSLNLFATKFDEVKCLWCQNQRIFPPRMCWFKGFLSDRILFSDVKIIVISISCLANLFF